MSYTQAGKPPENVRLVERVTLQPLMAVSRAIHAIIGNVLLRAIELVVAEKNNFSMQITWKDEKDPNYQTKNEEFFRVQAFSSLP